MKVDVTTGAVIGRPKDEVSSYAGDPTNAPAWYSNIDSVRWKTQPPLRVGSRMAFVARFMGRRLEYVYEVVELIPQERLVMRTTDGPFGMETTYAWEDIGHGRTRMSIRNRGEPSGFAAIGSPVMSAAMRRANVKDLMRLKQILERR